VSREGKTVVLSVEPELRVRAENQLDGPFIASPAIVDSAIYLRNDTHLYRITAAPGTPGS
jgi:hypothetical protein